MKISKGEVMRQMETSTNDLLGQAMRDGATVADVASAAASVRMTEEMRRKLGISSAKHDFIEAERLSSLSKRLVAIDTGDIAAAAAAAALISGKPVKLLDDEN